MECTIGAAAKRVACDGWFVRPGRASYAASALPALLSAGADKDAEAGKDHALRWHIIDRRGNADRYIVDRDSGAVLDINSLDRPRGVNHHDNRRIQHAYDHRDDLDREQLSRLHARGAGSQP